MEYFDIIRVLDTVDGMKIFLEEKNFAPAGFKETELESKGFHDEVTIQDFPIRHRKVYLCVKRRRWTVLSTRDIISRDWELVQKGTRMTKEFASFLKGILG